MMWQIDSTRTVPLVMEKIFDAVHYFDTIFISDSSKRYIALTHQRPYKTFYLMIWRS